MTDEIFRMISLVGAEVQLLLIIIHYYTYSEFKLRRDVTARSALHARADRDISNNWTSVKQPATVTKVLARSRLITILQVKNMRAAVPNTLYSLLVSISLSCTIIMKLHEYRNIEMSDSHIVYIVDGKSEPSLALPTKWRSILRQLNYT